MEWILLNKKLLFPRIKIDEINYQYHNFNKLHLCLDKIGHLIQISYTNDKKVDVILTSWFDMEQVGTHLENYHRMFCIDPNRIDRFFDITETTAILPIRWLQPTRKRPKGIANALIYIRQAYQGLIPSRNSISVRPIEKHIDLFDIIDGNLTYFSAKQIEMTFFSITLL